MREPRPVRRRSAAEQAADPLDGLRERTLLQRAGCVAALDPLARVQAPGMPVYGRADAGGHIAHAVAVRDAVVVAPVGHALAPIGKPAAGQVMTMAGGVVDGCAHGGIRLADLHLRYSRALISLRPLPLLLTLAGGARAQQRKL